MKNAKYLLLFALIVIGIFAIVILFPRNISSNGYVRKGLYENRPDKYYKIEVSGFTNITKLWKRIKDNYKYIFNNEREGIITPSTIYAYKVNILYNGESAIKNKSDYNEVCKILKMAINDESHFCSESGEMINPEIFESMYNENGECFKILNTFIEFTNEGACKIKKIN